MVQLTDKFPQLRDCQVLLFIPPGTKVTPPLSCRCTFMGHTKTFVSAGDLLLVHPVTSSQTELKISGHKIRFV